MDVLVLISFRQCFIVPIALLVSHFQGGIVGRERRRERDGGREGGREREEKKEWEGGRRVCHQLTKTS